MSKKFDIYLSISDNETKKELASFGATLDVEKPKMNNNILQFAFMLAESYVCDEEEWRLVRIQK